MDKHDRTPLKKLNLKNPWQLLAVGFGSGLFPKAPGTCGSLAALPVCAVLVYLPWWVSIIFIVCFTVPATIACAKTEQALGMHDNSCIVVDEFVGMFISVLFYPQDYRWCFLAFVLFRLFDILKPFPVSWADRNLKGALGVMLDDALAAFFALFASQIVFYFLGHSAFLNG